MEKIKPSPLLPVFFILLGLSLILSCSAPKIQKSQPTGVYHRVKKNETAQIIACAYQVRLQKLAQINNTIDLNSIKEGDVLFIPDANRVIDDINTNIKATDTTSRIEAKKNTPKYYRNQDKKKDVGQVKEIPIAVHKKDSLSDPEFPVKKKSETVAPTKPAPLKPFSGENTFPSERVESKAKFKKSEEIKTDKDRFIWPVKGTVKTRFGLQPNKTYNNWIKIVSASGTKVKAAASGTVIFSSDLKNYGETIIIRHKNNFATVYTHLKKRYVRIDQNVRKNEVIAFMAGKDENGEAFINFEIRYKGKALDPLSFLP